MPVDTTEAERESQSEAFDAWCKERTLEIRHAAAAHGWSYEYAFLREQLILYWEIERKFPALGAWVYLDRVKYAVQSHEPPLVLEEINKVRARMEYPALDHVPAMAMDVEHTPPKPFVQFGKDGQWEAFKEWAKTQIEHACYAAAADNISVEHAFCRTAYMCMGPIQRMFPDIGAAYGISWIQRVWIDDPKMRPATLDPERVRGIRAWSGTLNDVAREINKRVADAERGIDTDAPKAQA